jgi:NADH-quinone oxidoreductase subunit J
MYDLLFYALGFDAIMGGFGLIYFRHPMNSAISFLACILAIAGIFSLLSASFLFMIQIILYAGAVITIILFIIMFLNVPESSLPKEPAKMSLIALGVLLVLPILFVIYRAVSRLPVGDMSVIPFEFGKIKQFGQELFYGWLLPFELISVLLLVALVGAIMLSRKEEA